MGSKRRVTARWIALSTAVAATVAIALLAIGTALAAPPGAASFNLYAGKTTDVGDVLVWNDATSLFVEIDLAAGWCMTESHVHAAQTPAGIPQTNKGNPIPGQFAYGDTYSSCAGGDAFTIPLADLGTTPKVAVHAVVWDQSSETSVSAVSETSDTVYGPLAVYAAPGAGAWGSAKPAVEPTFASAGVWPTVTGATWISTALATEETDGTWADTAGGWVHYTAYGLARQARFSFDSDGGSFEYDDTTGTQAYQATLTDGVFSGSTGYACGVVDGGAFVGSKLLLKVTDAAIDVVWGSFVGGDPCAGLGSVDPIDGPFAVTSGNVRFGYDSWRWHRTVLTVPAGTWPVSGAVTEATADNAERVWHNGAVIGSDGEVEGAFVDDLEWGTKKSYGFNPVVGSNTLDFVWRNYGVPGLANASNPNGLAYAATASYYARSESAWAGTTPFSGANWATYFGYSVQDVDCVDGTGQFADGTTTLTIHACEGVVGGSASWVRVSGGFENDFSGPAVAVTVNPVTHVAEVTIEIAASSSFPTWVGWQIRFTVNDTNPDSVTWTWVTGAYAGGSASAAISGSTGFTITG